MSARADRPLGIVCRRDTPPPAGDRDPLLRLMRRIVAGDRAAFADLYRMLSPALEEALRAQAVDSAAAAAIISATFTEVWWMARFHTDADADIHAWTAGVVRRRAADRAACAARDPLVATAGEGSADSGMLAWATVHDQHTDNTLAALLGRPSGDISCLPRPSEH